MTLEALAILASLAAVVIGSYLLVFRCHKDSLHWTDLWLFAYMGFYVSLILSEWLPEEYHYVFSIAGVVLVLVALRDFVRIDRRLRYGK